MNWEDYTQRERAARDKALTSLEGILDEELASDTRREIAGMKIAAASTILKYSGN